MTSRFEQLHERSRLKGALIQRIQRDRLPASVGLPKQLVEAGQLEGPVHDRVEVGLFRLVGYLPHSGSTWRCRGCNKHSSLSLLYVIHHTEVIAESNAGLFGLLLQPVIEPLFGFVLGIRCRMGGPPEKVVLSIEKRWKMQVTVGRKVPQVWLSVNVGPKLMTCICVTSRLLVRMPLKPFNQ